MSAASKSSPAKRKRNRRAQLTGDTIVASFFACPRCSFFLSGYRLINGDYEDAVKESQGEWLGLSWNQATRDLIQKSYGSQINLDTYYHEGLCPDCGRAFIFNLANEEQEFSTLQLELHPS